MFLVGILFGKISRNEFCLEGIVSGFNVRNDSREIVDLLF
jgi:hypothetical protein